MPRYYDVSNGFKEVSAPKEPERTQQTASSVPAQPTVSGVRTMSRETFNQYQKNYNQWKRTGQYGDTSWMNQQDLDTFNAIRTGTGKSYKQKDGSYLFMDVGTYDKYGRNHAQWQATGDYGDTSWMNQADLDAFNLIRGSQTAEQNAFDDFRYSLDDNILETVRQRYKQQWGSKNYYDWTDPEDVARQAKGEMPKYLANKYKSKSLYDQWLYENDLPSTKTFNDMYSQAVLDWNERAQTINNIAAGLNDYEQQKADFTNQYAAGKDEEDLLSTGNYDTFIKYYGEDKDEDNPFKARQDAVTADDYTSFDNVYNALYSGDSTQLYAALNEDFWDKYTDTKWNKYLNGKLKWNEDTLDEEIRQATEKSLSVQATLATGNVSEEDLRKIADSYDTDALESRHTDIATKKADTDARLSALKTQPRLSQDQYLELSTLTNESEALQQQLDAVNEQLLMANQSQNEVKLIEIRRDLNNQWNTLSKRPDFDYASKTVNIGDITGSKSAKLQVANILASDYLDEADKAKGLLLSLTPAIGMVENLITSSAVNRGFINKWMTDDERKMFKYIANTQGADAAMEYAENIRPLMNERSYQAEEAQRKAIMDSKIGTTAINIARPFMQFAEAEEGFYAEIGGATGLWELEYHDPRLKTTRLRQGILQDTGEQILRATADEQGNASGWGQVLNTVYNMAQSTADNAVRQLVFGSIPAGGTMSALSMSGSVMGSTLSEYMDKGASADQAMTLAFVNAVAEGIGEKFTFDKYLKIKDGNAAINAALKSGKQLSWGKYLWHEMCSTAVAEAGEEAVTELIDKIMDAVVMRDDSEVAGIYNSVIQQGGTSGQAWWEVFKSVGKDIGMAAVGGAFSGVLLGGGNMALSNFNKGRAATGSVKGAMKAGREVALRNANTEVRLQPVYEAAYSQIQDKQHIRYAAQVMEQIEQEYKAELAKGGTADSAEMRSKVLDALIVCKGLTDDQKTAIFDAYEEFAASPASLLSEESKNLLGSFKEVLDKLDYIERKNGRKSRLREIKRQEAREKFVRDVTPIQQQRDQAKAAYDESQSQTDRNNYLSLSQQMKEADARFQRQEEAAQIQDDIEEQRERQEAKKATDAVIQAATDLADAIEPEETRISEDLYQRLSDARGGDLLAALGERLENEEMDAANAEYLREMSTDTIKDAEVDAIARGDDRTYNLLEDLLNAKNSGDDAQLAAYARDNPDIMEMMWTAELDNAVADENTIQEEMINGNDNGRNAESAGRSDDIRISGQERQDSDLTERTFRSGYSERGTDNESEDTGNTGESTTKSWDLVDGRRLFGEVAKQYNDKRGTTLKASDFEAIDKPLNEKSARALRRSIARTGGIAPRLYVTNTNQKTPNGFIQNGQIYIKDTGNTLVSFVYEHEVAHWNNNDNAIQRVGRQVWDRIKDRTKPVNVNGEEQNLTVLQRYCLKTGDDINDPQTLNEFICDIHGAYGYAVAHGMSLVSQLGLTEEDVEPFYEEFAKMGAVEAFVDDEDEGYQTKGLAGFIRSLIGGRNQRGGKADFNYHSMSEDKAKYEALLRDSPVMKEVVSEADISNLFDTIDTIMEKVGENEYTRSVLDFAGDMSKEERAFRPYKSNSDPHYKLALDFSTLCRKRLLTQSIVERLQSKLGRSITPQENAAIRNKIKEFQKEGYKVEVACALCYVEAARLKSPKVIDKFLNDREYYLKDYFAKSNKEFMAWVHDQQAKFKAEHGFPSDATKTEMKAMGGAAVVKQMDAMTPKWRAQYQPSEVEQRAIERGARLFDKSRFLSVESLTRMAAGTDDEADKYIYAAFITAVRSATRSKAQESAVPYYFGDVGDVKQDLIDEMNEESGFRHQSWSDFEITHLLDNIAAIIELSTRNAKMHAYTKVPAMVVVNGLTNMMLNMSLIPEGNTGIRDDNVMEAQNLLNRYTELLRQQESGLDVAEEMADVQRQLADIITMDPKEGMPRDDMIKLRDAYSKTAGNIMIGINDMQIRLLLASDLIDYVIPYHASGLNKDMRKRMGIKDWISYQNSQNEKANGRGTAGTAPKLNEWFDIDEAKNAPDAVKYMQEASQRYLDLCYERNLDPKFTQFLQRRADGSYELADDARNYWKLLIDRKMVDQTDNTIIEQKAVVPNFNKEKLMELLDAELQDPSHADDEEVSDKIVDMFLGGNLKPTAADKKEAADLKRKQKNLNEIETRKSIEALAGQINMSSIDLTDPEEVQFFDDAAQQGYTVPALHGSPTSDITQFDPSYAGRHTGNPSDKAVWFTDDPQFAEHMSYEQLPSRTGSNLFYRRGQQGRVYKAALKLEHPFDFNNLTDEDRELLIQMAVERAQISRQRADEEIDILSGYGNHQAMKYYLDYDALREAGYDSVIARLYPFSGAGSQGETDNPNALEYGVLNGDQVMVKPASSDVIDFSELEMTEPLLDPDGNQVRYAANIRPDKRTKTDYADLILNGLKTVETRKSRTLDPLADGEWQAVAKNGKIVGYVKFGEPFEYTSWEQYRDDFDRHRVPENAEFRWTQDKADAGERRFGYPIVDVMRLEEPIPVPQNYTELRKYKRFNFSDTDMYDPIEPQFSSSKVSEGTEARKQRAVEVQRQAQALYENGASLADYAKMQNGMYDDAVAAQLRGIYLRNGIDVGGRLADDKAEDIANDAMFWKRIVMPALQFPQRVFRKMGRAWDNKTDEGMMRNFHASEKYSNMFYSYKNQKLQEENIFKANAIAKVQAIGASETDSVLAQLIGERILSPVVAKNAITDGKWIVIPNGAGLMVLDKKGRVRYMMDSKDKFFFDDNTLKQIAEKRRQIRAIREDNQGNKADRIKAVQEGLLGAAKRLSMTSTFEVQGDTIVIKDGNKEILRVKGQKAYTDKAQQLANTLSEIYEDMHGRVQQTLVENGYKRIGYIEHYFPHFQLQRDGINGALDFLHAEDLPVSIAGLTEWFSPSKPWAGHLLERLGDKTDFNAVRGFGAYLNSVSDVIFMTPVIQRVRQLESIVRTGGDEETRQNNANTALVQWLHEYANGLANKKSALDRSVEALFGRQIYQIIPKISGIAGATYVIGNISSALTNFAPLFQAAGQMNPKWIMKGIFDTASDTGEFSDGIQNAIPFLTNRLTEIDQINLNLGEAAKAKGMKIMTALMNGVDQFSATAVARAKYYELVNSGMSQEDAIRETDKFCTDLFAERSKGSKPNLFNSRVLSPFTQFQLEPFNQLWHWSDIHDRNMQKEYERILRQNNGVIDGIDFGKMENQINRMGVAWKDIAMILGRMISMSVFGMLMRGIRGSDATWNPYGIVSDAVQGYQDEGMSGLVESVKGNLEDNLPFYSTMTGSSPVPVINVAQNIGEELTEDWNSENDLMSNMVGVAKNIPSAALYGVPAGSQIRKSVEGVKAYRQGGNYTDKGNLRYPIEQNGWNLMRSVLFGRSAVAPQNYRWGKDVIQGSDVEDYQTATERGVDKMDAYNFFLHDYNTNAKVNDTTRAAAIRTSNLDEREQEIIADVLGIKLPSDERLVRDLEKYRKQTERKHNKDKLSDRTYDRRMTAIDYYMELLSD